MADLLSIVGDSFYIHDSDVGNFGRFENYDVGGGNNGHEDQPGAHDTATYPSKIS